MSEQNAEAARGMDRQVRLASLHATVGEALDWIERMSGQEVRALEVDDTHLTGIDRGARVELDDLQGSLWDVLARVLEASGEPGDRVEWQYATDGAIVCAPVSRLNGLRTTVVYDIQDLLRVAPDWTEAPDLDLEQALQGSGSFLQGGEEAPPAELVSPARPRWMDLAELITSVVEPEVWSENGGESLLMHRAGVLVVKAPGYVHRQLGGDPNQPRADRGEAGVSRQ